MDISVTRQRFRTLVYILIGILGIVLAILSVVLWHESFGSSVLNLGTELIGGAIVFLVLRYLLLDRDEVPQDVTKVCGISSGFSVIDQISQAKKEVWLSGVTLTTTVTELRQTKIQRGCHFRFLIINPSDEMVSQAADHAGEKIDFVHGNAHQSLKNLKGLMDKHPKQVQVRTIDYRPSVGYFITDPDSPNGYMAISPYLYHKAGLECPTFILSRQNNRDWFDRCRENFEEMWNDATPYPPEDKQQTPTQTG